MIPVADPLAELRDIHLPADPSWWPPAVGWWILAAILLAGMVFLCRYCLNLYRRGRPARSFTAALDGIAIQGDSRELHHALQAMSRLARQYAITRYGRESIASLHGDRWLGFLDQSAGTVDFSSGPGHLLSAEIYQQPAESLQSAELASLRELLKRWSRKTSHAAGLQ